VIEALALLILAGATTAPMDEPPIAPAAPPPAETGPRRQEPDRAGIYVGPFFGFGGCTGCVSNEYVGAIGAAAMARSGWAFEVGLEVLFAEGSDECGRTDDETCADRQFLVFFLGPEARFHPIGWLDTSIDPYLAVGLGYVAGKDVAVGPTRILYGGFGILPRMGYVWHLGDLTIGLSFGHLFGFATPTCETNLAAFPIGCGNASAHGPDATLLLFEGSYRL